MKWEMKDLYKDQWHKGPPPSIGWWPTRVLKTSLSGYRWWNGKCWSWPAFAHESATKAAHWASKKEDKHDIEWTDRPKDWPERSRT